MESDKQIDNEKLKMDKRISKTLFYSDIRQILQSSRNKAYAAVNTAMVEAYWSIGKGFSVANLKILLIISVQMPYYILLIN